MLDNVWKAIEKETELRTKGLTAFKVNKVFADELSTLASSGPVAYQTLQAIRKQVVTVQDTEKFCTMFFQWFNQSRRLVAMIDYCESKGFPVNNSEQLRKVVDSASHELPSAEAAQRSARMFLNGQGRRLDDVMNEIRTGGKGQRGTKIKRTSKQGCGST